MGCWWSGVGGDGFWFDDVLGLMAERFIIVCKIGLSSEVWLER